MRHTWAIGLFMAAGLAAAATIHVPDTGISNLSDALAIAQPGDTILIAAGNYSGAATVTVANLTIEGQGDVLLAGVAGSCSPSLPPIHVENASGVVLRNLTLVGGGRGVCGGPSSIPGPASSALLVENSGLTLEACVLTGGPGSDAVHATDSTISFVDCTATGNHGRDAFIPIIGPSFVPSQSGGAGVRLVRSHLDAFNSSFTGGKGGAGRFVSILESAMPSGGGPGIAATDPGSVSLVDCEVTGGTGGNRGTALYGASGNGGCGVAGYVGLPVTQESSIIVGGAAGEGGGGSAGEPICPAPSSNVGDWLVLGRE